MTIGTSIMCGSFLSSFFTFTCHTPPRNNHVSPRGESKVSPRFAELRGLVIQKVEGLFAADSVPDSIEAPIRCQTSADRFRSLFGLLGQRIDFTIDFVVADLNFLQLRNAFQ